MLSVVTDINTIVIPVVESTSNATTDALVQIASRTTRTLKMDCIAAMAVLGYTTACSVPFGTNDYLSTDSITSRLKLILNRDKNAFK
jgi:hypothetical protein